MEDQSPRVVKAYRAAALMTFNTVVFFVVANLLVGAALLVRDWLKPSAPPVDARLDRYRSRFVDLEAYSSITREQAEVLLDEQVAKGSIGFRFEPWRHFREPAHTGLHLNVDARGFRRTRPPRTPSNSSRELFVFGGSTTFGYGVPDDHTIPSYLQGVLDSSQPHLQFRVRNLGQGFYYSSQALALLVQLIRDGEVPHAAVFVDGGNDVAQLGYFHDQPMFTPSLERMWDGRSASGAARRLPDLSWIPLVRVAQGLSRRGGWDPGEAAANPDYPPPAGSEDATDEQVARRVEYVTGHYLANIRLRRAICREYQIQCLFVWQPHVVYKYDRALHRTFPFEGEVPKYYGAVWAFMEQHPEPDLLYLGHMFEGVNRKVFVDEVHYNEETNQRIAERIGEAIAVSGRK